MSVQCGSPVWSKLLSLIHEEETKWDSQAEALQSAHPGGVFAGQFHRDLVLGILGAEATRGDGLADLNIILPVASALKTFEFNPRMSGHRETLGLAKSKLSSLG